MEVTGTTPQTAHWTIFVVAMFFVDVVEWVMVRWDCLVLCVVIIGSLPICLLTTAFPLPSSICFPNGNRTAGNAFFRRAVADRMEDYKQHQQAKNRHGMASVVKAIANEVHKSGGRFIDQNWRGTVRMMIGVRTNVQVYVV
jgi:uncharacterized membrane protein YbaN (DUF454 family)